MTGTNQRQTTTATSTPAALTAKHRRRRRVGRAIARAAAGPAVQVLEGRRLMSLTIALRDASTGADSAVATAVGQQITMSVVATIAAPDGSTNYDGLQSAVGSYLSAAVGAEAIGGDLSVTLASGFNGLGSQGGSAKDLNGDGHLDFGSNAVTLGADTYVFARAPNVRQDGTVANGTMSFVIATATYTVTSLSGTDGQTTVNFRPRQSVQNQNQAAAWLEGNTEFTTNENNGTFRAGSPFHVYTSAAQATTGSVTATAYADANGNGAADAGEVVQPGATVYVDLAGSGQYVSTDPSGVTDNAGNVTIAGVPAGTYAVRVVPPTGFVQTEPAAGGGRTVAVTAGGTVSAGAFGSEPLGSVAGAIYVDANGNGAQDADETSAPPRDTVVYLDANGNGTPDAGEATASTLLDGSFAFADVVPGTYALRTVVPAGYTLSQPAGGAAITVAVAPGGAVTGQTFGIAPLGRVTGTAFVDVNGNGSQDAADGAAGGVTVYLDANANGTPDAGELSAVTDETGTYAIADVPAGSYTVRDVIPTGATQSVPAARSYPVTVAAGATVSPGPFGLIPPGSTDPSATTGSIAGITYAASASTSDVSARPGVRLFLDANGNGTVDAGEATAVSAADGTYAFADLPAGTYTVRVLTPLGSTVQSPVNGILALSVTAGRATSGSDFRVVPLADSPLTAVLVDPPPATAIGTAAGRVRVRLANPSTDTAAAPVTGPVTFSLYATPTGTLASGLDTPIGTATRTVRLKAGRSVVVPLKYTLPASLAAGNYDLVAAAATADATGATATVAPALVTSAAPVAVTAAATDLAPTIVAPAAGVRLVAGRRTSVAVRLANNGNVTAVGTATVTVYATTTGTVDATSAVVGTATGRRVKVRAGRSVVVRVPGTAPAGTAAGITRLVAVVSSALVPADTTTADDTSAAVATR